MKQRYQYIVAFLVAIMLTGSVSVKDPEMSLPVEDQLPLLMKILGYDRNLDRHGEELVLGVAYQKRYRGSLIVKNEVQRVMKESEITFSLPIKVVPIPIDGSGNIERDLKRNDVDVLYVTPLRAANVEALSDAAQNQQILTLTGVPEYVQDGLSVCIDKDANKPVILINLEGAQSEGTAFQALLLKLATVIR